LEKAIEDYSEAIRLDASMFDAFNNRGSAHYEAGNLLAAVADYTSAITANPDYAAAYFNRSLVYQELGDTVHAAEDYSRAKQLGYRP
jgi:tetratricopeptide (TPR) repeat protein